MFSNTFIRIFLIFSFLTVILGANADNLPQLPDKVKDKRLLSQSVYLQTNHINFPFIDLYSDNALIVAFDYEGDYSNFSYRIEHCDKDWNSSAIDYSEYIEGFNDNPVTEYRSSFNTNIFYYRYYIKLPDQDIKITKSGNYKILVYKDYNPQDTVFVSHFFVYENKAMIDAKVRDASVPLYIETSQEIELTVDYSALNVFNPANDLSIYVWQNGNLCSRKRFKNGFIRDNAVSFRQNINNIFSACNEYRNFNTANLDFLDKYVKNVERDYEKIRVNLYSGYNRSGKPYIYERDINGEYIINAANKNDADTEADYTNVVFTLRSDSPVGSDVYVYGGLSDWTVSERFKMQYDQTQKAYILNVLLKQGYYNYLYAVVTDRYSKPDITYFEGSHNETENDYYICVYYRDISDNYDKLAGFKKINSKNHPTDLRR